MAGNEFVQSLLKRFLIAFGLLFLFIAVLLALPAQTMISLFPYADLASWRMTVDREISIILARKAAFPHLFAIILRQSIRVYAQYFQTVVIVIVIAHYLPNVYDRLYIMAPDWITDMTNNIMVDMGRSFSADDGGDCPDLELDDNFVNTLSGSRDSGADGGAHSPERKGRSFSEEDVATFNRITAASKIWMQEKTIDEYGDEDFVFDARYGVVPRSSRDRWKELEERKAAQAKQVQDGNGSAERKIPPVRYSQGD